MPFFTNYDLNKEDGQKDAFLSSGCLVSPKCGCNRVISDSRLSKPVLPIENYKKVFADKNEAALMKKCEVSRKRYQDMHHKE